MVEWWVDFILPSGKVETYTVWAATEQEAKELAWVKRKVDKAFG